LVTDFALGDLSVVPRLGTTERCLMNAEGSVDRARVRIAVAEEGAGSEKKIMLRPVRGGHTGIPLMPAIVAIV
jgi:hypothetical protein